MFRVNLSPRTKITIPVSFMGKNKDLEFDTEDIKYQASMSLIADLIKKLSEVYRSSVNSKELEKRKNELCEQITDEFCKMSPAFKELVGNRKIYVITVWLELVAIITRKTQEMQAENEAIEQINEEDKTTV